LENLNCPSYMRLTRWWSYGNM